MTPARGRLRCAAFALLLAPLALPAAANAAPEPAVAASERAADSGSNRWAHPKHRAPIRRNHNQQARRVAGVHHLTEDGFPEVYLVLRRWSDRDGRGWLKIRVPMRPNGRTGWVRDRALGRLHTVTTRLVVDRERLLATLYRSDRRVWRSRVGIGAPSTPTPAGRFWIRERIEVSRSGGTYGPWAFGTSAYSRLSDWPGGGVIGIHGTNQPQLIPGRPSHGCIRVANRPIKKLARLMPVGTAVRIR
jgi:hypothetical protein